MRESSDESRADRELTDKLAGEPAGEPANRAPDADDADGAGLRTCCLSGERRPEEELIRLVAGPDGRLWTDLSGRLPGRGAWISPDRAALQQAVAKKRLPALLQRSLRQRATVPDGFVDQVGAALAARALQRLGLERRAGNLQFGSDRLAEWISAGRIFLLVHARDASPDGVRRLDRLWQQAGGVAGRCLFIPAGRDQLAGALGRENPVHIGSTNARGAARLARELWRWIAFTGNGNPSDGDRQRDGRTGGEGQE